MIFSDKTRSFCSKLTVVALDDDYSTRLLLRNVLSAMGVARVEEASNAHDGIDLVKAMRPDFVISDWEMPGGDGLSFLREVREGADIPNPFMPVILITAHAHRTLLDKARELGVNGLLVKPLTAAAVEKKVLSALQKPKDFLLTKYYFGPDRRAGRSHVELIFDERRHLLAKDFPIAFSTDAEVIKFPANMQSGVIGTSEYLAFLKRRQLEVRMQRMQRLALRVTSSTEGLAELRPLIEEASRIGRDLCKTTPITAQIMKSLLEFCGKKTLPDNLRQQLIGRHVLALCSLIDMRLGKCSIAAETVASELDADLEQALERQ